MKCEKEIYSKVNACLSSLSNINKNPGQLLPFILKREETFLAQKFSLGCRTQCIIGSAENRGDMAAASEKLLLLFIERYHMCRSVERVWYGVWERRRN